MEKPAIVGTFYALLMASVIVGLDVVFFRHHFWARLMANIGVALIAAAFYLRFFALPWK